MDELTVQLSFLDTTVAEANVLAQDLRLRLAELEGVQVERVREDASRMDLGGTLVLVLGTPAVILVARALHAWVVGKSSASVRITKKDGTRLELRNVRSTDIVPTVAAFMDLSQK